MHASRMLAVSWTRCVRRIEVMLHLSYLLAQIQSREWDTGKPGVKPITPSRNHEGGNEANAPPSPAAKIGIRGGFRGGGRGGPGRGRGRGTSVSNTQREEKAEAGATPASPSASALTSDAQPEAAVLANS